MWLLHSEANSAGEAFAQSPDSLDIGWNLRTEHGLLVLTALLSIMVQLSLDSSSLSAGFVGSQGPPLDVVGLGHHASELRRQQGTV